MIGPRTINPGLRGIATWLCATATATAAGAWHGAGGFIVVINIGRKQGRKPPMPGTVFIHPDLALTGPYLGVYPLQALRTNADRALDQAPFAPRGI